MVQKPTGVGPFDVDQWFWLVSGIGYGQRKHEIPNIPCLAFPNRFGKTQSSHNFLLA